MCMEDVNLGREMACHYDLKVLTNATDTVIVPARPERVGLVIRSIENANFQACPKDVGDAVAAGMFCTPDSGGIDLTIDRHGRCVQTEWHGAGVTADVTVLVIETLLRHR